MDHKDRPVLLAQLDHRARRAGPASLEFQDHRRPPGLQDPPDLKDQLGLPDLRVRTARLDLRALPDSVGLTVSRDPMVSRDLPVSRVRLDLQV